MDGATIQKPAFFIAGELDPVSSFATLSTSLIDHVRENYDNLLIAQELLNVGHWTAEEAPKAVNEAILAFLKQMHHS